MDILGPLPRTNPSSDLGQILKSDEDRPSQDRDRPVGSSRLLRPLGILIQSPFVLVDR
jgi:hypothetical protein